MQIWNNVSIGILTKVNELASRYGLEPCDFVAEYKPERSSDESRSLTGKEILDFTVIPSDESKRERHSMMLDSLNAIEGRLVGSDEELFNSLNKALELAPRARLR